MTRNAGNGNRLSELTAAVQEKESLDTRGEFEYDVETYGEIRDKALSRRLRDELHINKN